MNIKEYISSGILEAYALGELGAAERGEVENNLKRFPELKSELDKIEEAQEAFLIASAITPRAELRTRILSAVDDAGSQPKVVALSDDKRVRLWQFAAAASVTIALISSVLAYSYWANWQRSESQLSVLIAQNQQIAQRYNQVNQRLDQLETDLTVMDNPEFTRVVMKGTKEPSLMASVYWNESSQEVFLKIQNMRELSQDQQYQLWAIIDGKPVDAGVFDAQGGRMIKMKSITAGATTFAVTIEPKGGKSSPTLETMQVAGNITKS